MNRLSTTAILLLTVLLTGSSASAEGVISTQPEVSATSETQAGSILETSEIATSATQIDLTDYEEAPATSVNEVIKEESVIDSTKTGDVLEPAEIQNVSATTDNNNNYEVFENNQASDTEKLSDELASGTEGLDRELASGTEELEKEPEVPPEPDPWLEKKSGKPLTTIKTKLEELQKLYNLCFKTIRTAESITDVDVNDRATKENVTLLCDITRQIPFTIYSSTEVFPELLRMHTHAVVTSMKKNIDSLRDEIQESPEEIDALIESFEEKINSFRDVNAVYLQITQDMLASIEQLAKANSVIFRITDIGHTVKKHNTEILELLKQRIDYIKYINEQLPLAIDFAQKQIDYLKETKPELLSIKSKYLSIAKSSIQDFEGIVEDYESKVMANGLDFTSKFKKLDKSVDRLIGKDGFRTPKILKTIKEYEYQPLSDEITPYSAKEELVKTFELFKMTEGNELLIDAIASYTSDASWQSRYEEPVPEKEKDEEELTGKKEKGLKALEKLEKTEKFKKAKSNKSEDKKDEKKKVIRERQNWELLPGERKRRKRGILGLFN